MNNKRNIITLFLSIFLIVTSCFFLYFKSLNIRNLQKEQDNKNINQIETPKILENNSIPKTISEKTNINKFNVSLSVYDNIYYLKVKEGDTVYDLMKELQNLKENNFSFKYKEYPTLGVFIDEINGISGKYWIYYVNNIEAQVGVSQYILKEGDSILWKQE